jgi:hypothetical protein
MKKTVCFGPCQPEKDIFSSIRHITADGTAFSDNSAVNIYALLVGISPSQEVHKSLKSTSSMSFSHQRPSYVITPQRQFQQHPSDALTFIVTFTFLIKFIFLLIACRSWINIFTSSFRRLFLTSGTPQNTNKKSRTYRRFLLRQLGRPSIN